MRSYDWPEAVKLYELCEGANLVILSLSMFCKESPFVVVFTGVTVLSQCFRGFFSVDFIEARTERKKTIVKDENSIYWKGFWKKGTGPLYPAVLSIDQKLWSLDIEGEKYIDNLWEVVKYKKNNQTSHFYQAPEKLQIVNHTTFFLLICRLIQKNGSKKEKKFNLLHCCVKKQDPW